VFLRADEANNFVANGYSWGKDRGYAAFGSKERWALSRRVPDRVIKRKNGSKCV
jgi:hypothetical protein